MTDAIKIAEILSGDLRPYRYDFYRRLGSLPDIELTLYVGRAAQGQGAEMARPAFNEFAIVEVVNRAWPVIVPLKVLWQAGVNKILRTDVDVIVCPELIHNLSIWWLRLRHRRFNKALVLRGFFFRSFSEKRPARIQSFLRRRIRNSAGGLITYTERGRDQLILEGTDPRRVFVSYNTLDTQRLLAIMAETGDEDEQKVRASLDLPADVAVVAFLGRMLPDKRADVAIEALELLARSGRKVAMLVIGDGPEQNALRIRAAGLPAHFLGSIYDEQVLAGYLLVTELLILPGRVGLTCVHGFANGVPCLTTSADTVDQSPEYEYVRDGYNGLVIPRPDPALYAAAIAALMDDSDRLRNLRTGALKTARELTMDRMVAGYMDGVRAALGSEDPERGP